LSLADPLAIASIALAVIATCFIVIYVMRKQRRSEKTVPEENLRVRAPSFPFRVAKSVPRQDASNAKGELRILDLEREILSDAIRRLYEAHAEGKITEEEREKLAQSYKSRILAVRTAISKNESIVALHELETMQEDLMKLFSERFDNLSSKIDDLRSKTEARPIREITITPKTRPPEISDAGGKRSAEIKAKRKKKQHSAKPSPRTEAEKRIEEITAEVEKILDRLGQMEVES
jgi:hypothetical protein